MQKHSKPRFHVLLNISPAALLSIIKFNVPDVLILNSCGFCGLIPGYATTLSAYSHVRCIGREIGTSVIGADDLRAAFRGSCV